MTIPPQLRDELLASVRSLRAFAISLCGKPDRADDLVQETLVKAWANFHSFQPGTNLQAWLFTILRNQYYSEIRKRRREVQDVEGQYAGRLATHAPQHGHLDLADFRAALSQLPDDQREALVLVGASGFSYEEAARICGVAIGTIKSRVSRARAQLARIMNLQADEVVGPDRSEAAAFTPLKDSQSRSG